MTAVLKGGDDGRTPYRIFSPEFGEIFFSFSTLSLPFLLRFVSPVFLAFFLTNLFPFAFLTFVCSLVYLSSTTHALLLLSHFTSVYYMNPLPLQITGFLNCSMSSSPSSVRFINIIKISQDFPCGLFPSRFPPKPSHNYPHTHKCYMPH